MDTDVVVNEKFDFIMLNIAKECGDINSLMNHFFSFLLRKTDFITNSKNVEQCEEIVLKTLRKYYRRKEEYLMKLKKEYEKMDEEKKKIYQRENTNGSSGRKDEMSEKKKNANLKMNHNVKNGTATSLDNTQEEKRVVEIDEDGKMGDEELAIHQHLPNGKGDSNKKKPISSPPAKGKAKNERKANLSEESDEDTNDEPPKGNGGQTEKYTWTQTINSLDMYINLEQKVKTKDIKLQITYKKLYVNVKNEVIIDGEFYKHIKPEDSIWTLEDNRVIHVCIEKLNGMEWWSTVIKGDSEIDVKKIVPENSRMEDLDAETRSVVEKMLYDQRQKAMNLPTSDEQKKFEIFEKFKKMHPEMDFSKANINYGSSNPNSMFFGR
ncbi:nuclear movement protein [Plasmodium vivax India VII]|uniref:Nuclear migration protein nudC n=2 Tax=Plasmodium vivax TaxID=5855 RepID=A0A0J9T776_PLAVI|nr:nuclear movement protein [Plasmodium vivax India VII]KMZ91315.1 nuclear movement protein [Plasmodium vivax Mauritania I]